MEQTFSDALRAFESVLPGNLMAPVEFEKLLRILSEFPFNISPGIAFESRLDTKTAVFDMFFSIENTHKKALLGVGTKMAPEKNWGDIRRFCEFWSLPGSPASEYINRIFLEFDTSRTSSGLPVPAVFFQIDEAAYGSLSSAPEPEKAKGNIQNIQWILDSLEILHGSDIQAETKVSILTCYQQLRPGSYIDHVAIMPSRIPEVVRVNINNLAEESLYSYMNRIGLASQISGLKSTLDGCWPFIDHVVLALDIEKEIRPRIGIELRLPKNSLDFASQSKWLPFLDHLTTAGLCTPQKKQGLIEWVGKSRGLAISDDIRFDLFRHINFIKAVFQENEPVHFKGYYSAVMSPRSALRQDKSACKKTAT